MKKCPYCFTELDDRASICSACRKRVFKKGYDGVAKKQSGCFASVILILAIMTVLMIFGSLFLKSPEQHTQTDDVAYKKSVEDSLKKIRAKYKGVSKKVSIKRDIEGQTQFQEAVRRIQNRKICAITKTKYMKDKTGLILGKRKIIEPLWYYKDGKIYCVNGAAKELTGDIPFTYEIDAITAFELLKD